MKCIIKKVDLALELGNIYCNACCEYYPCHYKGQNCSFCYCPFYPCEDIDLGKMIQSKYGDIWDCSQCLFNHNNKVVGFSFREFRRLGINNAKDPRIKDVFAAAKRNIFRLGKCVMVFGTKIGVSAVVAAICRLLLRKGCVVTPFKLQSICDDPIVTKAGYQISAYQNFQCRAAGITNILMNTSPIILKSKDYKVWQVVANGKNIGEYDANGCCRNFICGFGKDISKDSIDFLKKRYDYIIMEGSDFPSSVDTYDVARMNIEIAKIVDATCIFVVDIENENFLGEVLYKIEPMVENSRQQICGIILRILRNFDNLELEIRRLEETIKIPVIGVVSHVDVFSKENLQNFVCTGTVNIHSKKISVIKFPRMAYVSDIEPLYIEGVDIEYTTTPQNLVTADAIIIPDTKNISADLQWLRATGLFDTIKGMAGKIPIVGICGGFEIMAKYCLDMDGKNHREMEGLDLLSVSFRRGEDTITKDLAVLNLNGGGRVEGYKISTVSTENYECTPLFMIKTLNEDVSEGFADEKRQLYGTHLHGLFEKAAFRQYFISKVYADGVRRASVDYGDCEEAVLDRLADQFFETLDKRKFWGILERD